MKNMKTFLTTLAIGALALTLTACSTPVSGSADAASPATTAPATQPLAQNPQGNAVATPIQQGGGYGQQGGQGQGGHGAANQAQGGQMDLAANLPAAGEVDEQEIADLLQMREEEKLARDVYITLGEQWNQAVFTNISRSEQQHTDAIAVLLDRYGIADPVGDNAVGVFTNPDLQALYDQLVELGSQSLADALKVGATVEDVDIYDLQKALANTDNADIQQVYQSLMAGSENHMRAFVGTLTQQTGETYTPQYIEQSTFDAIMAASNSHGHGGQGQGGQGGHGQGGQGGHGKGGHGGQGQGGHGGHGQGGHGGHGKDGHGGHGQGRQTFNMTPNS